MVVRPTNSLGDDIVETRCGSDLKAIICSLRGFVLSWLYSENLFHQPRTKLFCPNQNFFVQCVGDKIVLSRDYTLTATATCSQ